MEATQAIDWAMTEFGGAELGDVRRTRRLVAIASGVLMRPGGTVGAVSARSRRAASKSSTLPVRSRRDSWRVEQDDCVAAEGRAGCV
jgi:uncharacterized membrane protein